MILINELYVLLLENIHMVAYYGESVVHESIRSSCLQIQTRSVQSLQALRSMCGKSLKNTASICSNTLILILDTNCKMDCW